MTKLLFDMLAAILLGIVGHQTRPLVNRVSSPGLAQLMAYTIGIACVTLAGILFYGHLPELQNGRRYFAANLLASLGVGSGVATGWLLQGG
jgi:hypothetical protein